MLYIARQEVNWQIEFRNIKTIHDNNNNNNMMFNVVVTRRKQYARRVLT